jgi:hypothetical protein
MHTPLPHHVPSEQTIEVLSDHFLLDRLNSPSAWIFCPTKVQEQTLGYDGSLQNGKLLLIQYKRVHVNRSGSLNVRISAAQHGTLRANFPRGTSRYVFYGFSIYPTYHDLDADYRIANSPHFFENMRFVELYDLPANCSSITYSTQQSARPMVNGQSQAAVATINGEELAVGITQCPIGLKLAEFTGLAGRTVTWKPSTPHVSILMFAM